MSEKLVYQFENKEEFIFFVNKNRNRGMVIMWVNGSDYVDYCNNAYHENEIGNHLRAIELLDYALKFNPVGLTARFEKAESYIMLKDYDKAIESLYSMQSFLISDASIARFYRRLGYILIEKEQYNVAYACFVASKKFEKNAKADNEIEYIRSKTIIGLMFDYKYTLVRNNIPLIEKEK